MSVDQESMLKCLECLKEVSEVAKEVKDLKDVVLPGDVQVVCPHCKTPIKIQIKPDEAKSQHPE